MKISKKDITFGFFLPSASKPVSIAIHPVHPWILLGEENRVIYLWDYLQKSVLKVYSSIDLDEEAFGGPLRDVKFFDKHVLRWKWLNKNTNITIEAFQGKGGRCNWIVVVMENKIGFFDYISGAKSTILQSQLDFRALNCVEIIDSSYLAIGCGDGSIKIWDCQEWELVKTFPKGTHTRGITKLLSFSKNLRERPILMSGSSDGILAVWNVDTCTDAPAFRIPSGLSAAHSGSIASLSLNPELMQLVSVGSEKTLAIWNVATSTEIARYKNMKDGNKKKVLGSVFSQHPLFPQSMTFCHSGSSQILAIDTTMHNLPKDQREINILIDLAVIIPGTHKILDIKIHELQPYLLFVVTQSGIYTLYYERFTVPTFGWSPLFSTNIIPENMSSPAQSHFFYCFKDDCLQSVVFATNEDNTMSTQFHRLETSSRIIGSLIELTISPSGNYLAALSKQTGLYDIFFIGSDGINPMGIPDRIKSGYTTQLVWHSKCDRFAVICPINEDDTTGSFSSIVSKILLLVYEVSQSRVSLIYRGDDMPNPSSIFGGNLLGITHTIENCALTCFYSWESLKQIGEPFPEPHYIFWSDNYCIIAYKTEFYVYKNYPEFTFLLRINHIIRTGLWCYSIFFYSTDTDVYWILPCLKTPYLLASHGLDINQELSFQSEVVNLKEDKEISVLYRKPHECCSILAVFQGNLLMVNSAYQLFIIPITSIFLRFCMLVSSGLAAEAFPLTLKMHEMLQPKIALCLESLGLPEAALDLPSLSYEQKIEISIKNNIPIVLDKKIIDNKHIIREMLQKSKNSEFLMKLYSFLIDNECYEEALLVASTLRQPDFILNTFIKAKMLGRAVILAKKLEKRELAQRLEQELFSEFPAK